MLVRTGDTLPSSLMSIHSSRKQLMIPISFILKMEEHSTEGYHRRLVRAGNLHQCTDAENRAKNLPLFATLAVPGGEETRKLLAVCQIDTRGSEPVCASSGASKKSGKYAPKSGTGRPRWCSLCPRGRLEDGNQNGGRRAGDENQVRRAFIMIGSERSCDFWGSARAMSANGTQSRAQAIQRVTKHSASDRRIDRGVRAGEAGYEPFLPRLGRRLRPTPGPRFVPRRWGTAVGTLGPLVHERQARKAAGDDGSFP